MWYDGDWSAYISVGTSIKNFFVRVHGTPPSICSYRVSPLYSPCVESSEHPLTQWSMVKVNFNENVQMSKYEGNRFMQRSYHSMNNICGSPTFSLGKKLGNMKSCPAKQNDNNVTETGKRIIHPFYAFVHKAFGGSHRKQIGIWWIRWVHFIFSWVIKIWRIQCKWEDR